METVRVSSKGQVVIPKRIRQQLSIRQGDVCQVEVRQGAVVLYPRTGSSDWRRWEGILRRTRVLEEHLDEHRRELKAERCRTGRLQRPGLLTRLTRQAPTRIRPKVPEKGAEMGKEGALNLAGGRRYTPRADSKATRPKHTVAPPTRARRRAAARARTARVPRGAARTAPQVTASTNSHRHEPGNHQA